LSRRNAGARSFLHLLLASVLLLSTACASAHRRALGEEQRKELGEFRKVSSIRQREMDVTIRHATGGRAFGLIGMAVNSGIDSDRRQAAEARVTPVRKALAGHDVPGALRAALEERLAAVAFLGPAPVEAVAVYGPNALRALTKPGRPVLLVEAYYRLTPAFDGVTVAADVWVFPARIPEGEPADAALFRNALFSVVTLPPEVSAGSPEMNAALLAADDGRLAKAALQVGIEDLARLVAFDLAVGAPEGGEYRPPTGAKRDIVVHPETELTDTGWVVGKEGGRVWVRLKSGVIYSQGKLPSN